VAVLAGGALALAACGVPTQDNPVAIAKGDLPQGLLSPSTTSTTLGGPRTAGASIDVYFVSSDHLVAVTRGIPRPPSLDNALGSLLAGPSLTESAQGIRSAISQDTAVLATRVDKGVAVIDLSAAFADIGGIDQILAVGQLVFTATGLPDVASVSFQLNDRPVAVPSADGSLVAGPVTRAAYAPLLSGLNF
jgi:spore germination protein GerM